MDDKTLNRLHQEEFNILCDIDAYCKKHRICYSLYAGTLIGAVRHSGFIPWDDDVDLCMTRTEYTRFCEMIRANPMPGYYFESYETDEHCSVCHGKIRRDGTVLLSAGEDEDVGHHGIWVDIFPLDKVEKNTDAASETLKVGRDTILLTRAVNLRGTDTVKKRAARLAIRIVPKGLRRKRLLQNSEWIRKHDAALTADYDWVSMSTLSQLKVRFPKEMTEGVTELTFCGQKFQAYKNYTMMLETQYGDYMKLPPEEERVCKHNPIKLVFRTE